MSSNHDLCYLREPASTEAEVGMCRKQPGVPGMLEMKMDYRGCQGETMYSILLVKAPALKLDKDFELDWADPREC